ncbi:hypothetical protein HYH02_009976 [Chlamydomonas schloesseri]|uniref:Uncharacterized protein n=1 Tax=Chlamydomonas schloesseri TaxID=2026947 RepID=A0A835W9G2_9CHLO|nr:hypothetical protein HYH02_009976 [Chlamydomonas schloesseri]|eukprot:KAG2441386.1 hypothetical protein HYH02_009976 [Chlamydomonas schloesseri]
MFLTGLAYLMADTGLTPGGYVLLAWGPEMAAATGSAEQQPQRLVMLEVVQHGEGGPRGASSHPPPACPATRRALNGRVTLRTFFPEATAARPQWSAAQDGSRPVHPHLKRADGGLSRFDTLLSFKPSATGNNVVGCGLKRFLADAGLQPGGGA